MVNIKEIKYCSDNCGEIFRTFKRKHPTYQFEIGLAKGLLAEYFVKDKLEKEGWFVFVSKNSRSIFDLIAIKDSKVKCIQVTTNIQSKNKEKMIKEFADFKKKNDKIDIEFLVSDKKGDYVSVEKVIVKKTLKGGKKK